ncbi:MAG TPA: tetratricopeptide repeat protein [Chthoniobacterales bacterium]
MKTLVLIVGIGAALATSASPATPASPAKAPPPELIAGLGNVHHPVSTRSKQAQAFFDQGLNFVYGFNHDGARRSFEEAARLDPKLAMAWWGVALTLGPNYNLPVDLEGEKAGYEAVQKAVALQANASEPERAYISALAVRYTNDPKADLHQLDRAYREAMGKLSAGYPEDLDAATLYAESIMNLNPWHLWTLDGKPADGTEEIISVLESVLKRDPNHLGANHYYIHAVEASPHPERGLASAARLEKLAPASGHLVHMPAHIYARVGDHAAAAHSNEAAASSDKAFLSQTKQQGVYRLMYYSHNLHFLAYAATMDGNFAQAKDAAARLVVNVAPGVKAMPMLEGFLPTPILVLVGFERWPDILALPAPDPSLAMTTAVWHFARGLAQANLGNTAGAAEEQLAWQELVAQIPPDTMYDDQNKTGAVFEVHKNLLLGALARSRGDHKEAVDWWSRAVAAADALNYTEPPSCYPPVRPLLGRELLASQQFAEAEKVFRTDLEKNPRDARALAGLRDCLMAQNRTYDAEQIAAQYQAAWKGGATEAKSKKR